MRLGKDRESSEKREARLSQDRDKHRVQRARESPAQTNLWKYEVNCHELRFFDSIPRRSYSVNSVHERAPTIIHLAVHLENEKWANPSGVYLHKLVFKVGCPVNLLMNLNPANDTRLLVKSLKTFIIECTILTGCGTGEDVLIPQIPLVSDSNSNGYRITLGARYNTLIFYHFFSNHHSFERKFSLKKNEQETRRGNEQEPEVDVPILPRRKVVLGILLALEDIMEELNSG
ncbi:hypothetical protein EVAR_59730_1 [Eumeta japonica]|uniref:Uncharacterized protein n=1 Tax=Eumeta variegata TaxID=151549 RepID=A0A4C1XGV1_EUMVA|nr:hypothetical protein EVAR_59730_1 [Eumeta japonica]